MRVEEKPDVEALWRESQKNFILNLLRQGQNMQEIMESLPGFKEAFTSELDEIDCSDERVPAQSGKKIGLAGQLILAGEDEINSFIERHKGRIKKVNSHDNCGAAGLKYAEMVQKGEALPEGVTDGDSLGVCHSKSFAEKLGAEYNNIDKDEMTGDIHNARAICFDGTGRFNPSLVKEMPVCFVCSAPGFGLSDNYCKTELATLIGKVAFGSHGFGDRFTGENPLYIFVSAKDKKDLKRLMEVAEEGIKEFGERVKVEGFVAEIE